MASISSGVGLISGLPINDLVDALIAVQSRPISLLKERLDALSNQRTSFLKISANLLAVLNSAARLKGASFFQGAKATTSDENSVLATASAGAAIGQFQVTVKRLASAHQVLSAGFTTADSTPVGAGTLTIETAQAKLNLSTRLAALRGGAGIQLGKIRIGDRAGGSSVVDLTTAVTIDDVVRAINSQSAANVIARVEGDHLVLADQTGLTTGTIAVSEVGAGVTATQLGILGSGASGILTGANLVSITSATRLGDLNDENGIRRLAGASDLAVSLADGTTLEFALSERISLDTPLALFNSGSGVPSGGIRIKTRAGGQIDVDLSSAVTIGDVKAAIESGVPTVSVTIGSSGLVLSDRSTGQGAFTITNLGTGGTAHALGIEGSSTTGTITGKKIYFVDSVGDLVRLINTGPGNGGKLVASISSDGLGLALKDTTSGAGTFQVTALNGSKAAGDLGLLGPASGNIITSRRLVAGLNTVLLRTLNGGAGVGAGVIQVTDRAGTSATIDLSGAESLAEVIQAINGAGTGIRTAVSANGLGMEISDGSNGAGALTISDVSGTLAADLHIAGSIAAGGVSSGNLQRRYISEATLLKDLRNGAGIPQGKFRLTDSSGATAVVDLTQGNEEKVQDVIDEINSRGLHVVASINATGDGLLLTDTAGGAGHLRVTEEGGTTAKALGILGQAASGATTIDGSFESRITLTGNDSLQDLLDKIKATGAPVSATILRDASSNRPYRLNLVSNLSGLDGALAIDSGSTGLSLASLTEARDASIIWGSADADAPLVIHSASNTLADLVPNVRLDLLGTSNGPVNVSIASDTGDVAHDLNLFVSAVNTALTTIDDLTHFDDKTNTRSVLTGDSTVRTIRQHLIDLATHIVPGLAPPYNRLSAVGIELADGNSLQFDQSKLDQALSVNSDAVRELFSRKESGLGAIIELEMKRLTDTGVGAIPVHDVTLKDSQGVLSTRIDQLTTLLVRRRERLKAQFGAMESVLAKLQGQQAALSRLGPISLGVGLGR